MKFTRPPSSSSGWAATFLGLLLAGCSASREAVPSPPPPLAETTGAEVGERVHPDTLPPPEDTLEGRLPEPIRWRSWSDSVLASLTLEEKAGQLLMPWVLGDFAPVGSSSHRRIAEMVEALGVGGIVVSVGSPTEVAVKLNDLQRRAPLPLLVAADLETGAGYRMRGAVYLPGTIELGGATDFPSLMAVGATGDRDLAYEMGRVTALEARAVGIHVPFAPVLDVNNNPDNPIINIRSLGENPEDVARLGTALVRGIQEHGGIATGKHFPGHGDTETDSHLGLPVIRASRERLDSVELLPFRRAISEGMGGVMTAHISVPALDSDDGVPATLSPGVLTDLLRGEMGFDGLTFTDAMDMFAVDRRFGRGEAAVRALEAGADVLLMPPDVAAAKAGVAAAVRDGRLSEERVDASVLKVLQAKERMGLHVVREVRVEGVPTSVGIPANEEVAQRVANRSITLLKNERDLLPLLGTRRARVLSVSFRRASDLIAGRYFNGRLRQRYARLVTAAIDRNTPESVYEELVRQARTSSLVLVSLYVDVVSSSGSVAIPDEVIEFIQTLAQATIPHVVVSFGNPYLVRDFPDAQAYLLAWSGAEVSQRAAAMALFGDLAIGGRLPTRIPPLFEIGAGIQLPRREAGGGI
jgi:beta-N-acetylhexosaminidase